MISISLISIFIIIMCIAVYLMINSIYLCDFCKRYRVFFTLPSNQSYINQFDRKLTSSEYFSTILYIYNINNKNYG